MDLRAPCGASSDPPAVPSGKGGKCKASRRDHWRPPPLYDEELTEKEKRERPMACFFRFETYDEMWARLYTIGHEKEMEASKLLEKAVKESTKHADRDGSKAFEAEVPNSYRTHSCSLL